MKLSDETTRIVQANSMTTAEDTDRRRRAMEAMEARQDCSDILRGIFNGLSIAIGLWLVIFLGSVICSHVWPVIQPMTEAQR
jgi:hypothetical protein